MTIISDSASADIRAMRQRGLHHKDIAQAVGLKPMTVYQHLRRCGGLAVMPKRPAPANDNHPDRVTRMAAHNGGCSTLSGMMPVTLKRVPSLDGVAGEERVAA